MFRGAWQSGDFSGPIAKIGMTPPSAAPDSTIRRYGWTLLLAYPLLAIAGAVTHRQIFALLALVLLLTVVMLPHLLRRRLAP